MHRSICVNVKLARFGSGWDSPSPASRRRNEKVNEMVPPRLTVVSRNDNIDERSRSDDDEPAAAEARELARAIAEVEGPRMSGAGVVSDRREKLRILEALLFASAEPLDEPPGERSTAHGFCAGRVSGWWAMKANSVMWSLPRSTAPACSSRSTAVAVRVGMLPPR